MKGYIMTRPRLNLISWIVIIFCLFGIARGQDKSYESWLKTPITIGMFLEFANDSIMVYDTTYHVSFPDKIKTIKIDSIKVITKISPKGFLEWVLQQ